MFQELRYLRYSGLNPRTLLIIGCGIASSVLLIFGLAVGISGGESSGGVESDLPVGLLRSSGGNVGVADLRILGEDGGGGGERWEEEAVQRASGDDMATGDPVVRISRQGRIRGTVLTSRAGRDYYAFYKVPFARPPVGELRFKPPQRAKRWRGIYDGSKPGEQCIQNDKSERRGVGSEDCLYLNIYTRKVGRRGRERRNNYPVMFYLHGGFASGNGTRYGGKYFMDEDVVLVTMEYRMGLLAGFNIPGNDDYPGNLGRRDQIAALEWVQRNIEKFGGDPKKVVIFGNSGGGIATHLLLVSPMSAGLFSGAIMQSGSGISKGFAQKDISGVIGAYARDFGCNSTNSDLQLLTCMRGVDAEDIVINDKNALAEALLIERVNEEGGGDISEVFMSDTPWRLINGNRGINQVPLIVGINSREYTGTGISILLDGNKTESVNENWSEFFTTLTGIRDSEDKSVSERFYKVYFGEERISNETRIGLFDLEADKSVFPSRIAGLAHANATGQPVYFYWVNKEPIKSYATELHKTFPPPYGAAHADELQYLFNYDGFPEIGLESPWLFVSKSMVSMWVSFGRDGSPTSPTAPWNQISLKDRGMKWFQIDDELKVVEPFTERMSAWDEHVGELFA